MITKRTDGEISALLVVATIFSVCEPTTKPAGEYVHVIGAADTSCEKVAAAPEGGVWVYANEETVTVPGRLTVQSIFNGFSSCVDCLM